MEHADTIAALEGRDISKATSVTYALDGTQSEAVLAALRHNLRSEDADLVEITTMRLGVRFKDAASFKQIIGLALTHPDELVVMASLKAVRVIAERNSEFRNDAEATLKKVYALSTDYRREEAAREYLHLVGEISMRQYALMDKAKVVELYETVAINSRFCRP